MSVKICRNWCWFQISWNKCKKVLAKKLLAKKCGNYELFNIFVMCTKFLSPLTFFVKTFLLLFQQRMRSSLVVRASDCQCISCNGPGFDPSIRWNSGICGVADEAVLNIIWREKKTFSTDSKSSSNLCCFDTQKGLIWP